AGEIYALPGLTQRDAQAIVAYRRDAGNIDDARALVAAGILGEEKLRRLLPFLQTRAAGATPLGASGTVTLRAEATYASSDDRLPATALFGKAQALGDLTMSAVVLLDRNALGDVRWDPSRGALSATVPGPTPSLAKIYADWRTPDVQVVAGTFKSGFG